MEKPPGACDRRPGVGVRLGWGTAVDKGNARRSSEFAQRQAARWLGMARLPPEGLTPWQAAELLAEGDTAGNRRWLGMLADAIKGGELAVTATTHTPPDVPWWRQNQPMEKTLRAPKPEPKTIRRIAYADLSGWLAFIGAPVPDWLPGDASNLDAPTWPEHVEPGDVPECEARDAARPA